MGDLYRDRFEHAMGDWVLAAVGRCLQDELRSTDWAARLGGDEFLLVLDAPLPEAGLVLERIRRCLTAL
jgi:diguanylate cyclase (GGDEF)-like protein